MDRRDGGGRRGDGGRIVAVDALRGLAILWVVLFHLWGDLEYFPAVPRVYYEQLWQQLEEGNGSWAIVAAFSELVFRKGFQGVPLFMMISGLSLTVAAYRAGDGLRWPSFIAARFRRLLAPYWLGVALTYGVIALIAWRLAALHGTAWGTEFGHGVTISEHTVLDIDGGVVAASVALAPRLLRDEWFFAPQLALWFVGLLAQYYLLFPFLFVAMRRMGVALFLVAAGALTVGANVWAVHAYAALELKFFLVTGWAPFRLLEFALGMGLGWLLVDPGAARLRETAGRPAAMALCIALGLAAMVAGDLLIGWWTFADVVGRSSALYLQALALPLVSVGLALLCLPVLAWRPSRPAAPMLLLMRPLAMVGVMSYAILIVNDAMRLVASQLRVEDVPAAVWWSFLVVVYVPASVALAWPLAVALGHIPSRRKPGRSVRMDGASAPVLATVPIGTGVADDLLRGIDARTGAAG